MIEVHPFGEFVPRNCRYLILGSFPGRITDWFYGSTRNQFWKILEEGYHLDLKTISDKKKLLTKLKIALGDVIYSCERKSGNNLDINLINIIYNQDGVKKVLNENGIEKIFFTSKFVEGKFKQHFKDIINLFPHIKLITLPSPSPRFAKLNRSQKVEIYKDLLPRLE